jgi:drug/metabolite transporter (DMT)-like permease
MMPSISSSSPSISDISRSTPWYRLPRMSVRWWIYVLAGVACCTFVFPALINDAIFKIPLALLLTLESIGPLYSLPVSWMVQKEVPTLKSCAGALLAFVGVAILSLKGMATGHSTSV